MKPIHVLLFLLAVLAGLGIIGAVIPADGVVLGDELTLRMPSPREVLFPEEEAKVDISDILAVATDSAATTDTGALADSLTADTAAESVQPFVFDTTKLRPLEERIALHYPNGDKQVLWPLFAKLEAANGGGHPLRIMHYGDSQLEGDRITAYLRNKLQSQFGGSGPGLVAVADIVPSFSIDRVISDNWIRYSVMGRKDPTQHHSRYGALSSFSRFTPILADTAALDTTVREATVTLKPLRRAYGKAQQYNEVKLYYGWHRAPVTLEVSIDGVLLSSEEIAPADRLLVREWKLTETPAELTFTFKGVDSPDVFGISLESRTGVAVDNIAARGGAGYEFRKADQGLLSSMYKDLDVELLILQYGGNVIPNLKSAEEAAQYGRFLRRADRTVQEDDTKRCGDRDRPQRHEYQRGRGLCDTPILGRSARCDEDQLLGPGRGVLGHVRGHGRPQQHGELGDSRPTPRRNGLHALQSARRQESGRAFLHGTDQRLRGVLFGSRQ
jgi:hypothetical protein